MLKYLIDWILFLLHELVDGFGVCDNDGVGHISIKDIVPTRRFMRRVAELANALVVWCIGRLQNDNNRKKRVSCESSDHSTPVSRVCHGS